MNSVVRTSAISLIVFSFWLLAACNSSTGSYSDDYAEEQYAINADAAGTDPIYLGAAPSPFDEDSAREEAIAELEDSTYEEVVDALSCTYDCSGHNAGFEWARDNEVYDPDSCGGYSESFIEGCRAYSEAIESRVAEKFEEWKARS